MKTKYTIEELSNAIFPNIYGKDKLKEILILQYLSNKQFNVLVIADSSTGRKLYFNQILSLDGGIIKEHLNMSKNKIIETKNYILIKSNMNIDIDLLRKLDLNKKILAFVTPKYGKLDVYGDFDAQISFPKELRFSIDIIYFLKDTIEMEKDLKVFSMIFDSFQKQNTQNIDLSKIKVELDLLKEQEIIFSMDVYNKLKNFFLEHRFPSKLTSEKILEAKPIESHFNSSIAYGNLNQILKYVESYSKLNSVNKAGFNEINLAIELFKFELKQYGIE